MICKQRSISILSCSCMRILIGPFPINSIATTESPVQHGGQTLLVARDDYLSLGYITQSVESLNWWLSPSQVAILGGDL